MSMSRTTSRCGCNGARLCAFTLPDLLVSLAVVAILIALLLPSLGAVRETTRRVVCASNQRQAGIGLEIFADTNKGTIPSSQFMGKVSIVSSHPTVTNSPENTMTLRIGMPAQSSGVVAGWDGLGKLYEQEYLRAPEIFYCPSHKGFHEYREYSGVWSDERETLIGNYQYRALSRRGDRQLATMADAGSAILSDGLRTRIDFNHDRGANVLRADLSVHWFYDAQSEFADSLPSDEPSVTSSLVEAAWQVLDKAINNRK